MLNRGILAAMGGAKDRQMAGDPGEAGFGVGVYAGDPADLTAIGLTPMPGCEDPLSENCGNYIHTNGSVMVFIPAFVYRIGQPSAPSYSRDGANALEIRDAFEMGMPAGSTDVNWTPGDGWALHRSAIDGGVLKLGFFVDKYLCSKKPGNLSIAVSMKSANQISLSTHGENSSSMTGCDGYISDAITLSRARGEAYSCVSAFQWSALSILSLACGQAAKSAENCAWYDSNHKINFPKGCNNGSRGDTNDSSVKFDQHPESSSLGKTGSGAPFAKTTHNGQDCGVADVNGCMCQPLLGLYQGGNGTFYVAKESYRMHDFTKDNCTAPSSFNKVIGMWKGNGRWGSGSNGVFTTETSGAKRAMCGVYPASGGASGSGTDLFGTDFARQINIAGSVVMAAGTSRHGLDAGVWFREGYYVEWTSVYGDAGVRAAGYAN